MTFTKLTSSNHRYNPILFRHERCEQDSYCLRATPAHPEWWVPRIKWDSEYICWGKMCRETQTIWPLLKRASPIGGRSVGIESYNGVAGV